MTSKPRIIGLDYGTKRIGVSMTDSFHFFVQSVGTFNEIQLIQMLKRVDSETRIITFVVGYPLSYNKSTNKATEAVDKFIGRLKKNFPLTNIIKQDEYLSTKKADLFLQKMNISRKKRKTKGRVDSVVACQLLEKYLLKT